MDVFDESWTFALFVVLCICTISLLILIAISCMNMDEMTDDDVTIFTFAEAQCLDTTIRTRAQQDGEAREPTIDEIRAAHTRMALEAMAREREERRMYEEAGVIELANICIGDVDSCVPPGMIQAIAAPSA
jgi:hypothetical protein